MQNTSRERVSKEEANKMLNEILEEDQQENEDEDCSDFCSADCAEEDDSIVQTKCCECVHIADNSSRFSLRVMEAMRSLQNDEDDFLPTSSAEDIVSYIQENYRDDGDLYAQVRTALKQVCSQGFAMEVLDNEYHLIGPDAISMNQITCSKDKRDCLLASPIKRPKYRKEAKSKDKCICETPSDDESRQGRSKRRKVYDSNSDKEQNNCEEDKSAEETTDCTCSLTLTDEDANELQGETQNAQKDGDRRANEKQRRAQQLLIKTPRARITNNQNRDKILGTGDVNREQDIDENDSELHSAEDYETLQRQSRSKKDKSKMELKRWIERCRDECERRKNRRSTNN